MNCRVFGCERLVESQKLVGDVYLCDGHLQTFAEALSEAQEEVAAIHLSFPEGALELAEMQRLLYPAGKPRLRLVG